MFLLRFHFHCIVCKFAASIIPFKIPSLNVGRYGHCAVSCDGNIYTFGGRASDYGCVSISELELYGQDGWISLNQVNLLPRYQSFAFELYFVLGLNVRSKNVRKI